MQWIGIEEESKQIISVESSDSSNYSLLIIDTNILRFFHKEYP